MAAEKLILLSDVHANLPALEAVLGDIEARGLASAPVCFLGDAVNLGPFPAETISLLRSLSPAFRVRGNHDRYISGGVSREELERYLHSPEGPGHVDWTISQLSGDDRAWLGSAPVEASFELGGAKFRCFHASPGSDEKAFSPGEDSVNVLCGHIHSPYIVGCSGGIVVNPGSVGGPLDGNTASAYAVLTVDGRVTAEIIRVAYDLDRFSSEIRRREVPWGSSIDAVVRRASFT